MLDSLYTWAETMPWEKSPNPGTMAVWFLLTVGFTFVVTVALDILSVAKDKKKRPW